MVIHVVQPGETLYSIAAQYGTDVYTLEVNNGVSDPARIAVGQSIIVVLPLVSHVVQEGETLYSIAQRYGVNTLQLYRNNLFLGGRERVYPGQVLTIEQERDPIGSFQTGGYAYPFISRSLLDTTLPFMTYLMPFTYGFRPDGSLIKPEVGALLEAAFRYQTAPVMHLSTLTEGDVFSTALAEELLNSVALQEVLLRNVIETLRTSGYYGLDIDFEFLGRENAQKYADFITRARETLNPLGYPVLVALAPKTSANQPGTLYEGHDYAALGAAANCVLLMTYEWGYTYGPPMAVSPIQPVRNVVEYALTEIPAEKIFLGISNYGYDFVLPYVQGVSMAESLSTVEATELAVDNHAEIFFDADAQAPYFTYSKDGRQHIVWFEDARSLDARLRLLPEYGLRGALYWNLMRPNPQNLVLINTLINLQSYNLF